MPIIYGFNPVVFHVNFLQRNHVTKKSHLFLMKIALVQVDIIEILSKLIENLLNAISIICFIGID